MDESGRGESCAVTTIELLVVERRTNCNFEKWNRVLQETEVDDNDGGKCLIIHIAETL